MVISRIPHLISSLERCPALSGCAPLQAGPSHHLQTAALHHTLTISRTASGWLIQQCPDSKWMDSTFEACLLYASKPAWWVGKNKLKNPAVTDSCLWKELMIHSFYVRRSLDFTSETKKAALKHEHLLLSLKRNEEKNSCTKWHQFLTISTTLTRDPDMDSGAIHESVTFDPPVTLDQ